MRAPPPVELTSALGRAWRGALSLLVGASVAVPLAWGLPYFAAHWGGSRPDAWLDALARPSVQLGLAAWVGLVFAAGAWLSSPAGRGRERTLRWDGQDWVLPAGANGGPEQRGEASLMLDLGPWMLVRFLPYAAGGLRGGTWLPFHLAG
ncbi:MAG TPA: hypothetical protein VF457_01575, partial [Burkholderiaceae bacterium]